MVAQLLTEMGGIEPALNVFVVAATNRRNQIDPALLRSGRFGLHLKIPLPNKDARKQILNIQFKDLILDGMTIDELSEKTENFNGADIEALAGFVFMASVREYIRSHPAQNSDEILQRRNSTIKVQINPTHMNEGLAYILQNKQNRELDLD